MKVQDPDGTTWTALRRITPWPRYFTGSFDRIGLDGHLWRKQKAGRWAASGRRADALASRIRAGDYPQHTTVEHIPRES